MLKALSASRKTNRKRCTHRSRTRCTTRAGHDASQQQDTMHHRSRTRCITGAHGCMCQKHWHSPKGLPKKLDQEKQSAIMLQQAHSTCDHCSFGSCPPSFQHTLAITTATYNTIWPECNSANASALPDPVINSSESSFLVPGKPEYVPALQLEHLVEPANRHRE